MLVDINLIPKSSKKIKPVKIVSMLMSFIFIIAIIGFLFLHNQALKKQGVLENQFNQIVAEKAQIEQTNNGIQKTDFVDKKTLVKLMEEKLPTMNVLKPFVEQIPTTGSILSLEYNHSGVMSLDVQLSSYDEIADYINHLTTINWVREAQLIKVSNNGNSNYVITIDVSFSKDMIQKQAGE